MKNDHEDLSLEFQWLYRSAIRAYELIPLMYNRLTLVDKLTHKDAITKIYNDHRQLAGFTTRNIRRYLPSDNPAVPRRVRTLRPKNSYSQTSEAARLSTTQHEQSQSSWTNYGGTTSAINIHQLHEKSNMVGLGNQIAE